MNHDDRVRIQKEVVLGLPAPDNETSEERKFRADISADVEQMKKRGIMATYPTDWDVEK